MVRKIGTDKKCECFIARIVNPYPMHKPRPTKKRPEPEIIVKHDLYAGACKSEYEKLFFDNNQDKTDMLNSTKNTV